MTSMLVTDIWDEMSWKQLEDVGDAFGRIGQWPMVTNTHYLNIQKMSPSSKFSHQYQRIVANITSPTSQRHQRH